MDVNGTRFHLIADKDDWLSVQDTTPAGPDGTPAGSGGAWDDVSASVTLKADLPLFPRGRAGGGSDPAQRRGAASDRFGTWYWIGNDRKTIWRAPAATTGAVLYWQQAEAPTPAPRGAFAPVTSPLPPAELGGLAVTAHHYLVVGILQPAGLLIFDLHAGGDPVRWQFPAGVAFEPFDLAATTDGGVWVLDRVNRRLWGVDRYFRLLPLGEASLVPPEPGSFATEAGALATPHAGGTFASPPQGVALPEASPPDAHTLPDGVEILRDGSLLVLDRPAEAGAGSRLYHFRAGATPGALLPPEMLTLPDLSAIAAGGDARPVVGYDLALAPDGERLMIVEQEGNQAIAYRLRFAQDGGAGSALSLHPEATYLPLHYFGGRALAVGVTPGGEPALFYDVTPRAENDQAVRWVRLREIELPRYRRLRWLEIPPLDGHQHGVTWHRLFLDGCIPPETEVQVWTRWSDDRDLLEQRAYVQEPGLYLRGRGAELPYWSGWPKPERGESLPAGTGTWEVLFQQAQGRWLQVRLVLAGNGRATPRLLRLRAYYPRFSYLRNYLPAAYAQDEGSAGFMERFLANMEGFYSELEGKIGAASALLDPRSAPAETLDWLATWMGLVLDPLWARLGEARQDRRRLMIRFARRLYERRGTVEGLRFALLLLLDPCLEDTLRKLERATVVANLALQQELAGLGLPYPTPATGEAALEDLLFSYVLAAPGRNRVRIVERWQARQGLALASGDVTAGPDDGAQPPSPAETIAETAHRFSVLI
ncbi:MAG TPA: phage tail protein, partial [Anaerolineae bacterium]|nr:phage tail protein [Anaerolineae bacterium]